MLLFQTGSFRMMGKCDDLDAHFNAYHVSEVLCKEEIPNLILQTMTYVYKYSNSIDLYKLSEQIKSLLNLEGFPGLQVWAFKPIHVNVFSTGRVIMTGIKDVIDANYIKSELDKLCITC